MSIEFNKMDVRTNLDYCLYLNMLDKNGAEYLDGAIVEVEKDGRKMHGHVRYSFGRFEIVCPFKERRFIFGLNPAYEIKGHMHHKNELAFEVLTKQSEGKYE